MRIRSRMLAVAMAGVAMLASIVVGGGPAHAGGAFVPMQNNQTRLCLQPASPDEFAAVVQEPCNGQATQGWLFQRVTGTRYKFLNQSDGLCINEFDPLAIGARLLMVQCVRVSNEEW